MLWFAMAAMCLAAIAFVVVALLRDSRRQAAIAGVPVAVVVAVSFGLYGWLGSPDVPSGRGQQPDIAQMVTSLAARLEQQPDDVNGWKMLGRSYMTLGNFAAAVGAYEKAVELESALNAQTLVDLAVAVAQADGQQLTPRAVSAFENALAIDANHPEALFYGGIAAFNRGDKNLAADRWERLLASDPPEEVRAILQERIAVWRGQPLPQRLQVRCRPRARKLQLPAQRIGLAVIRHGAAGRLLSLRRSEALLPRGIGHRDQRVALEGRRPAGG